MKWKLLLILAVFAMVSVAIATDNGGVWVRPPTSNVTQIVVNMTLNSTGEFDNITVHNWATIGTDLNVSRNTTSENVLVNKTLMFGNGTDRINIIPGMGSTQGGIAICSNATSCVNISKMGIRTLGGVIYGNGMNGAGTLANSGDIRVTISGTSLANESVNGLYLRGSTAATSANPIRRSPALEWGGLAWDGTASRTLAFKAETNVFNTTNTQTTPLRANWLLKYYNWNQTNTTVFEIRTDQQSEKEINTSFNFTANYLKGNGSLLTGLPNQYNNPFDQVLNTTSNVTFNNVTANRYYIPEASGIGFEFPTLNNYWPFKFNEELGYGDTGMQFNAGDSRLNLLVLAGTPLAWVTTSGDVVASNRIIAGDGSSDTVDMNFDGATTDGTIRWHGDSGIFEQSANWQMYGQANIFFDNSNSYIYYNLYNMEIGDDKEVFFNTPRIQLPTSLEIEYGTNIDANGNWKVMTNSTDIGYWVEQSGYWYNKINITPTGLQVNGNLTINNLTGSNNTLVCVNAGGMLYRC